MTIPAGTPPLPPVVARLAGGRVVRAVWRNDLGGVTFAIGGPDAGGRPVEFVKTGPGDHAAEAARLDWAGRYLAVPRVLGFGPGWLHTVALPGRSAVDPRWVADPVRAARAIGTGLRVLHDNAPVGDCPFDWSVRTRLAGIRPAARAGLGAAPAVDRLVVCHGDACAPNTVIDADGRFAGLVDLGALGVADRWADLAVATLSLGWNYGEQRKEECEGELLGAYGLQPDAIRLEYYRRLWEAPELDAG